MELRLDNGKSLNIDNAKGSVRVEKTDSIEINKNSKGYTWSVKAYGDSLSEIQDKLNSYMMYAQSVVSGEALGEQWRVQEKARENVNKEPDAFLGDVTLADVRDDFKNK